MKARLIKVIYHHVTSQPKMMLLTPEKAWGWALAIERANGGKLEKLIVCGEQERIVHVPVPIVSMEPGTIVKDRLSKNQYRFVRASECNVVLERTDTNLPLFVGAHEWFERFGYRSVDLMDGPGKATAKAKAQSIELL